MPRATFSRRRAGGWFVRHRLARGRCGVNPSEQFPAGEWTALDHLWEDLAEAWFRPDGDRSTYRFRVPGDRFPTDDAGAPLTVQTLLEAAALPADEVESWRVGDAPDAGEISADLNHPLPPP